MTEEYIVSEPETITEPVKPASQYPETEITDAQSAEIFNVTDRDILGDDDGNFSDVLEISEDEDRALFNVTREDVIGKVRPKKLKYQRRPRQLPPGLIGMG